MKYQVSLCLFVILLQGVRGAFNPNSRKNVAVYWGQNSVSTATNGQTTEKNLTDYCSDNTVDIVLLSFLNIFPGNNSIPTLTLHGEQYSDTYQHILTDVAADIKACQKHGKIVLLSLGGESTDYGFESESDGAAFASTLWQMFGDANSTRQVRPFGDVKIDGFDLDIETNSSVGYQSLGDSLRKKFTGASKKYYLSAAPQCPYPEAALGPVLNNTFLDFAFIQFYNNQYNCDANTDKFNWDQWVTYASEVSSNKDIKLFMGIPGSLQSSASGYIDNTQLLKTKIGQASSNGSFGGIMLWDASSAGANKVGSKYYLQFVKDALNSGLSKYFYSVNGSRELGNYANSAALTGTNYPWLCLAALAAIALNI